MPVDSEAGDGETERDDGRDRRARRGPRAVTETYLENAALHHLQRYACSTERLRRVLMRRVDRSARVHGTDPAEGAAMIERLLGRLAASGLVDDQLYAGAKLRSLRGRGRSQRAIKARLGQDGLAPELIDAAFQESDAASDAAEIAAGIAHARRRRLGPFRPEPERAARRANDLASLARAGFAYDTARAIVDAADTDALEALTDTRPT